MLAAGYTYVAVVVSGAFGGFVGVEKRGRPMPIRHCKCIAGCDSAGISNPGCTRVAPGVYCPDLRGMTFPFGAKGARGTGG